MSQYGFLRWYFWLCIFQLALVKNAKIWPRSNETYGLVFESLNDGKCPRVMNVLHNKPINCLAILAVDPSSFDKLGLEAGDRLGVLVAVEVDAKSINHGCYSLAKSALVTIKRIGWIILYIVIIVSSIAITNARKWWWEIT